MRLASGQVSTVSIPGRHGPPECAGRVAGPEPFQGLVDGTVYIGVGQPHAPDSIEHLVGRDGEVTARLRAFLDLAPERLPST